VVLLVRGPSPSCGFAGRRVVTLGRGVSRVRFLGRFHGRPLAPGTYGITMVARRRGARTSLGSLAIAVVPSGQRIRRSAARPVFDGCEAAPRSSGKPFAALGLVLPTASKKITPPPVRPRVAFRPPRLHLSVPKTPALLPVPGGGPAWLGIVFYLGLMLAGGLMIVLVARFMRGSWNP
jgi:hypothetical protein